MRISTILTSYNRPKFVAEALQSVANQTIAEDIHVVVVDDGSNQETINAINEFNEAFGAFVLLEGAPITPEKRKTTNRVAININIALRYLWSLPKEDQPQYISYIGDDDLYFTSRCEIMANFLDKNPDAFLAYHFLEIHRCDQEGKLLDKLFDLKDPWTPANQFWVERLYNRIDHISFVHRMGNYLWEEDPYFSRVADWGFLKRLLSLDEKFIHLPQYLAQGRKIIGDSLNMDGVDVNAKRAKKEAGENER